MNIVGHPVRQIYVALVTKERLTKFIEVPTLPLHKRMRNKDNITKIVVRILLYGLLVTS